MRSKETALRLLVAAVVNLVISLVVVGRRNAIFLLVVVVVVMVVVEEAATEITARRNVRSRRRKWCIAFFLEGLCFGLWIRRGWNKCAKWMMKR